MKKILFIFGTRPEGIKMAPLIKKCQENTEYFDFRVCVTGQHREMLNQVMDFFKIKADYDLKIMRPNQSLFDVTIESLQGLKDTIEDYAPDLIFVQGDTTSVLTGALAAYYLKIDIAHLEAGLRSGNKYSPFPEEGNRILAGHLAKLHFAPTAAAKNNLLNEGINEKIWVVGNTVVDALLLGLDIIKEKGEENYYNFFKYIDFKKKIILVTGHRRESFGKPFEEICEAIKKIVINNPEIEVVYPVHLNPNVRKPVNNILKGVERIHIVEPLEYPYLIWLLSKSHIVLTDSGGIQEEAPTLGKPVLVMRDVTERQEGIEAGTAKLVGTKKDDLINETQRLLDDKQLYQNMAQAVNPYGEGDTSDNIIRLLKEYYKL